MAKARLKVDGMHCASCERLIAEALEELPGAGKVTASQARGAVEVAYDEKLLTEKGIIAAIKREGFTAKRA